MSLKRVSGWIAECDSCRQEFDEYMAAKGPLTKALCEEDWFRRGSLVICWHCLTRRACRIFGCRPSPIDGDCYRCDRHVDIEAAP